MCLALPLLLASHASVSAQSVDPVIEAAFKAIDKNRESEARAAIAKIDDPLMRKTLTWFLLRDAQGVGDTTEIDDFLDANPDWPDRGRLERRAEELIPVAWPPDSVIARFGQHPPVSDAGRARLAAALIARGRLEEGVPAAREIWREGDFTAREERHFYRIFRPHLRSSDHVARLDRLLWDGRFSATRRMFTRVPNDIRMLGEARFLLRHRRGNVDKAIARVPSELKNHEGLVYERLHWRRRKGRVESAVELLADSPASPKRPDLWARERIILARRSLENGLISEAYELVRDHGIAPTEAVLFSEAEWYAGWIALRFLQEYKWAYDHFRTMYKAVSFPVSRARGAYWSGRAAEALGETAQAKTWFSVAASFPETYYGQLALSHGNRSGLLPLPEDRPRDEASIAKLQAHELARASVKLVEAGARNRIRPLILGLADLDDTAGWKRVAAVFARSMGRPDLAINIAKSVRQNDELMIGSSHPTLASLGLPVTAEGFSVEPALVHAIIRQESGFFISARSHAGALGLMQIMPATARQVARANKLRYNRKKLRHDAAANMVIGRAYLENLLETFDGSYILTLVAYNAGPSRAKRWMRQFGDPRTREVDPVDWVEMIPFDETRNYVQRVLENLQVYRVLLQGDETALQIAADLRR